MRTDTTASQTPIARDFKNVVDDAHELLKTVQTEGEAKIGEARTRVQDSLNTAYVKLADVGTQVTTRAKAAATTTDEYVRANPWQAVGVGALAGAVLGFLIARR